MKKTTRATKTTTTTKTPPVKATANDRAYEQSGKELETRHPIALKGGGGLRLPRLADTKNFAKFGFDFERGGDKNRPTGCLYFPPEMVGNRQFVTVDVIDDLVR